VTVGVYNSAGELVVTLLMGQFPKPVASFSLEPSDSITSLTGSNSGVTLYWNGAPLTSWNGTNASGTPVYNGTYFIKVDCVGALGSDQSAVQTVTVSRPLKEVMAEIYNEAGEVVNVLYQAYGANGPVTAVQLSSQVLQIGPTAQGPMTIGMSNGVTLTWDGSGAGGTMVTSGVYYLEIYSENGTGKEVVITKDLTVVNGGTAIGNVSTYPNPWQSGYPALTFKVSSTQPLTLKVRLYDLAGERVAVFEGSAGTGQAVLSNEGFASGVYIAVVELRTSNGDLAARQTIKVAIFH
jgi:flagellar hook assembly protein FlgD